MADYCLKLVFFKSQDCVVNVCWLCVARRRKSSSSDDNTSSDSDSSDKQQIDKSKVQHS